jgi:hypothetical protein
MSSIGRPTNSETLEHLFEDDLEQGYCRCVRHQEYGPEAGLAGMA